MQQIVIFQLMIHTFQIRVFRGVTDFTVHASEALIR